MDVYEPLRGSFECPAVSALSALFLMTGCDRWVPADSVEVATVRHRTSRSVTRTASALPIGGRVNVASRWAPSALIAGDR